MGRKGWYTWEDIGRLAGFCILPEGGAWVTVVGCPMWPRGKRIIPAHRAIGIRHMDIYWGGKEELVVKPKVNRYRKRNLDLTSAVAYDISQGATEEQALERAVEELKEHVVSWPFPYDVTIQASLITVSHPHHEEVKFYNGEVRVYTVETIRLLLADDCLEVRHFGETRMPVLEDAARELVDALQVDGLSYAQAYQEVVACGEIEPVEGFTPQWFYRPKGWYRDRFCEEEDYEQ